MSESPNLEATSLIMVQFLAWVADRPRSYAGTMEAWRTNCPRMPIWENAVSDGLVTLEGGGSMRARKVASHIALAAIMQRADGSGECFGVFG